MQKAFITGIAIAILSVLAINSSFAYTKQESKAIINGAIAKYKSNNFLGCISDLKLYTEQDPNSSVAWYYLGSSYMKIAMKDDAKTAFDKVIEIDDVPQLTSYSIQAEMCMEDGTKCEYQSFNKAEIERLKADPVNFMQEFFSAVNLPDAKDAEDMEIEKLIDGTYQNNIHPDADEFIQNEQFKIKQAELNSNRSSL